MHTASLSLALLYALSAVAWGSELSPPRAAENPPMSEPLSLMSFSGAPDEPAWIAVNDGVMGGLSRGAARITDGHLHFEGVLSLENNGGFASVRTRGGPFQLQDAQALLLRVLGDGRTYQLRMATDARFRRSPVSFGAEFSTTAGQWTEVRIGFESLQPTWRGTRLSGPAFEPAKVEEIGLLLGDAQAGPFHLVVDWIRSETLAR